jgi:hypothetical protein
MEVWNYLEALHNEPCCNNTEKRFAELWATASLARGAGDCSACNRQQRQQRQRQQSSRAVYCHKCEGISDFSKSRFIILLEIFLKTNWF